MSAPDSHPVKRFADLLRQATEAGMQEPTAMSVSTVDAEGRPSARMLLLKGADARGFVFFTNLRSRKARDLAHNPHAALCFFWDQIGVQVRVEGTVEQVSAEEADEYFSTRPRGSQIGAWASDQSAPLEDRRDLESRLEAYSGRFAGREVPRPAHWSGFRLRPDRIEFWTGRPDRLHDREVYLRTGESPSDWRTQRLNP